MELKYFKIITPGAKAKCWAEVIVLLKPIYGDCAKGMENNPGPIRKEYRGRTKKKSGKSGDEEPEAEKYIFGDKMVALDGVFESRT